jgi:hypothetical protein
MIYQQAIPHGIQYIHPHLIMSLLLSMMIHLQIFLLYFIKMVPHLPNLLFTTKFLALKAITNFKLLVVAILVALY